MSPSSLRQVNKRERLFQRNMQSEHKVKKTTNYSRITHSVGKWKQDADQRFSAKELPVFKFKTAKICPLPVSRSILFVCEHENNDTSGKD